MQKKIAPDRVRKERIAHQGGKTGKTRLPKGKMLPFKSDEAFRILVENLNEVIFTLDVQGKIIYISPAITQISN